MWTGILLGSIALIAICVFSLFASNKELAHSRTNAPHWPPKTGDKYRLFHRFARENEVIYEVGRVSDTEAWVNVNRPGSWPRTNVLSRNTETGEVWEWRSNMGENEVLQLN